MTSRTSSTPTPAGASQPDAPSAAESSGRDLGAEALVTDVLVEEVSIDGLCGVY